MNDLERLPRIEYGEDYACIAYLDAIENAILMLSANRAATDRLLHDLRDAHGWCYEEQQAIRQAKSEDKSED